MNKIIKVPATGDGRFKQWTKTLTGVDRSKKEGFAFQGKFVDPGRLVEVPVGALFLCYGMQGSVKYHEHPEVKLFSVTAEGGLESLYEKADLNRSWALEVRDEVADIVEQRQTARPTLSPEGQAALDALLALPDAQRAIVLALVAQVERNES